MRFQALDRVLAAVTAFRSRGRTAAHAHVRSKARRPKGWPASFHSPPRLPVLAIQRLHLWQPVGSEPSFSFGASETSSVTSLFGALPFAIACELGVTGYIAPIHDALPVRYCARFFARDLASCRQIRIGRSSRGCLSMGESIVMTRLRMASLPRGSYRLVAVVTLEDLPARTSSFELDLLEVI